jgi:hypothetical protein
VWRVWSVSRFPWADGALTLDLVRSLAVLSHPSPPHSTRINQRSDDASSEKKLSAREAVRTV